MIGNWGSIDYYSSWNTNHMQVVCRQLGYTFSTGNYPECTTCDNIQNTDVFPTNLWKTDVECSGNEPSLIDCDENYWTLSRVHKPTYDAVLVHCKGSCIDLDIFQYNICSYTVKLKV